MRAPVLILLALFALPLLAGEQSALTRAVGLFRSPDAGARTEGSKLAEKELRRLLAPLLEAMQDKDPEVRRRVREAILSLVPYHDREAETATERQKRFAVVQAQALQVLRIQIQGAQVRLIPQVQPARPDQKAVLGALKRLREANALQQQAALVNRFGLHGSFTALPNRMRGFRVTAVAAKSTAQKAGLRVGDVIVTVNGKEFKNYQMLLKVLDPRRGWSGAKLKVARADRVLEFTVK